VDKIIHLDPYFPTGEATVQPVSFWSGGKNYGEYITKHASVASDLFKNITPIPGHSIVYVLAVSAWETWGENRNSDAFPELPYRLDAKPPWISAEDVLPLHYKTFEQFGYNYRHHCFPAGTLITMADRSRIPIEEITAGEQVETLEGPRSVARPMHNEYSGEGVKLRLRGIPDALIGTVDHPVLTYSRDQIHCKHGYSYLGHGTGCYCSDYKQHHGNITPATWRPLSEVLPGDYLVLPDPPQGEEKITPEFARLVGWVASEGYLGERGAIKFTFSENNVADIAEVSACLRENGIHVSTCPRPSSGLVELSGCCKEVQEKLFQYIRGVKSEKTILGKLLSWDRDSRLHFLGAYIDGDGCITKNKDHYGQLLIRSSSPQMLRVLADVIRSLGVPTTIHWDTPAGTMLSPTNHKVYSSNGSGVVSVEPRHVAPISCYSRKKLTVTERSNRGMRNLRYENTNLVRVLDREDIELNETVYNLEVEGAHHYFANDVVVHNCNNDPAKSVGRVMKAFWNPTMHRVELLIDLDDSKAMDLAERIRNGEFPPVSMGTRVKWDCCTICGNRAPTRAQYCDHLKFQMRDVIEGKKVAALNPSPKFFDISWVTKPADTTAYMMKKVAEHAYEISGAAAGEYLDKIALNKAAAKKLAVIDKIIQGIPVDAKSEGIDAVELANLLKMREATSGVGQRTPDLPDEALRKLSCFGLPKVFSTLLVGQGMTLSTPELMKLAIYRSYPTAKISESLLDKAVASQHSVMDLFADAPQLLDQLKTSGALDFGIEHVEPKVAEIIAPYVEKRAGIGAYLKRRFLPEDWQNEASKTNPLTVTDPGSGNQYGTTRGAAVAAHDEIAKRNLYKVVGGAALLGGAYKLIGHGLDTQGYGKVKPLLALGLGALGGSQLPSMGKHYMTDQGIPIPTRTELAKTSADNMVSLALPIFGTLGTMAALSHDYQSRLRSDVPLGYSGLPLSRRVLDKVETFAHEHPLVSSVAGAAAFHGLGKTPPMQYIGRNAGRVTRPVKNFLAGLGQDAKATMSGLAGGTTKISEYLGDNLMTSGSTVLMAEVDVDKLAEWLGEILIEA
jgi:intein/homing endonuclease